MITYVVVLVLSITLLKRYPDSPWRILLALAPMIPASFILVAFVRYLGRMDEFQRRIQLDAIGASFGGIAIITFAYGFLENVGFPRLSFFVVWPLMATLWGLGALIASRRYR